MAQAASVIIRPGVDRGSRRRIDSGAASRRAASPARSDMKVAARMAVAGLPFGRWVVDMGGLSPPHRSRFVRSARCSTWAFGDEARTTGIRDPCGFHPALVFIAAAMKGAEFRRLPHFWRAARSAAEGWHHLGGEQFQRLADVLVLVAACPLAVKITWSTPPPGRRRGGARMFAWRAGCRWRLSQHARRRGDDRPVRRRAWRDIRPTD